MRRFLALALVTVSAALFVLAFFMPTELAAIMEAHNGHSVGGHGWGLFLLALSLVMNPMAFKWFALLGVLGLAANFLFFVGLVRLPFSSDGAKSTSSAAAVAALFATIGAMFIGGISPSRDLFVENAAIWMWFASIGICAASLAWYSRIDEI